MNLYEKCMAAVSESHIDIDSRQESFS
jgi:hypothetical protein